MRYLFGDYVLDTQREELHGAGVPIKLRRKVFQVLAYLLAHRDRVVSKQELLEHLWPEQFVGDEALKSCMTALRKALGEQDARRASSARCTARAIALWRRSRCRSPSQRTLRRPPSPHQGTGGGERDGAATCAALPPPPTAPRGSAGAPRGPMPLAVPWRGNTNRSPCCAGPWPRRLPWRRAWGPRRCTT